MFLATYDKKQSSNARGRKRPEEADTGGRIHVPELHHALLWTPSVVSETSPKGLEDVTEHLRDTWNPVRPWPQGWLNGAHCTLSSWQLILSKPRGDADLLSVFLKGLWGGGGELSLARCVWECSSPLVLVAGSCSDPFLIKLWGFYMKSIKPGNPVSEKVEELL